jgi:hypothetical protein
MRVIRNHSKAANVDSIDARRFGIADTYPSSALMSYRVESLEHNNWRADKAIRDELLRTEFRRAQYIAMARQYLSYR